MAFQFKQFAIQQDKTSMKVGTDGVLLGAWADVENIENALDIGTGTGLISLMIAQRSNATIQAIEIEENAYNQAIENFNNSIWHERLAVTHTSLQNYNTDNKFDLIISNPPFFINSLKTKDSSRNLARHTDSLSFTELLSFTANHLNKNKEGKASFIIPSDSEKSFLESAKENNLFPTRITRVRGNENSNIKRSLIELRFHNSSSIKEDVLTIEISRHVYTKDYINLTKDFYLKM